jgi:DNA-binding GntR family transcriptional regulator
VHLILSGESSSGGWVDEKQVIQKLRVSRTPFREAIGILAKAGVVEIKPYRGFYVRSVSRNETADAAMTSIRYSLAVGARRHAA